MPGNKKKHKKAVGRQGGGSQTKVEVNVEARNVQNTVRTASAGDFENDPCEDSVTDKLNEAQLLDDSTEVVILSRSDNDIKNNNESKGSSMVTLDSGYADQSISSEVSVQKAEGSFTDTDGSFNDSKASSGTRDPFEVSFSGAIYNNASKGKDKPRTTTSSGRKEVTKVFHGNDLKTIEDYIDLGVDPVYAAMQHPLLNAWTFWYFMGDCFKQFRDQGRTETEAWNMCQKNLSTVDTIEGFWQVFNHIERPSRINLGCDYCFFKKGIEPDWADFQNKYGGRWVIEWKDQDLRYKDDIDSYWMEILFILIGEHGEPYNNIVNGAVINVRKNKFRIGVWLKGSKDENAIRHIGALVKERLGLRISIPFHYHEQEQHSGSKRGSKIGNMSRITV